MRPEQWLYTAPLRLRSLFRRRRVDEELDEELRYHLERKTEENMARGMSAETARRAALLDLRGMERAKDECRDTRGVRWLEDLAQDLRYGLRMLRKSPGFTTVAVLTLALGIGANTAIFSLVNAVILRPLPYRDSGRLVTIWATFRDWNYSGPGTVCDPDYIQLEDQQTVFSDLATFRAVDTDLTGAGDAERLTGAETSANLFGLLGVQPEMGRTFSLDEQNPARAHVVILSQKLWARKFASDKAIVGKSITLGGESYTIIGIMAPDFEFPNRPEFWKPIVLTGDCSNAFDQIIAHLGPGITLERAQKDLDVIFDRLARADGRDNHEHLALVLVRRELTSSSRYPLLVLLSAVGLVLLIACANVANLFLARGAMRQREISVRKALGASRSRVVRLLLTESTLIALLGGTLGLLLARTASAYLSAVAQSSGRIDSITRTITAEIDVRVLLFTAGACIATGLLFGLVPALHASRAELRTALTEMGTTESAGARSGTIRNFLVIGEFTLTLVLLISAGLVLKSFVRLTSVDPGFSPRNVLTMNMELTEKYKTDVQMRAFHDAALQRIRALPGVYAAGTVAFGLPFDGFGIAGDFTIAGQPPLRGVTASKLVISPGYFRSLEIPLMAGREFSDADTADSVRVAIVSRSFAQRLWPHSSAIGQRIDPGFEGAPLYTIVGVVGDVKQDGLDQKFPLMFYLPYAQAPRPFLLTSMTLVVRTAASPAPFVNAVRREIQALDPEMPVFQVASMEQLISRSVSSPRLNSILIGSFAGLALVLAAVGIYGVMSYSVAQRKHEIGIRMALGGTPHDIVRLVVGRGLLIATVGIASGLVIAVGATRLLSGLLFGVRPTDAATFVSVPFFLALVALVACYVPAQRAIKVDPMVALRHE